MNDPSKRSVLVWDLPVRVFHWLLAASFTGAYLTAESERWRLAHLSLGYTVAALVVFRLVWGLVGTRHARFADFVRGPRAAVHYLRSLLRGRPDRHLGHNPAGALAIVALLGLALAVSATGWGALDGAGGEWLGELHEALAAAMLAVVGVHLAGVLLGSWLHRENLVRSMITGRKTGDGGIGSARPAVAALLLAGVFGFWWLQWQDAPAAGPSADRPTAHRHAEREPDDD